MTGCLTDVPGRPRVVTLPGHTPGSVGYLFADRGLLFTGDALVTYDGITGHRGPTVVSRAFTHDSRAALASLTALGTLSAGLLLPGHGEPFAGHARRRRRPGPRAPACADPGPQPMLGRVIGNVVMHNVVSVDGFIADENDEVGPAVRLVLQRRFPIAEDGSARSRRSRPGTSGRCGTASARW